MNNKKRRSNMPGNGKSSKRINILEQKIINLARTYNSQFDILDEEDLPYILDNPNFDSTFTNSALAIDRELTDIDFMSFKAELLTEASLKLQRCYNVTNVSSVPETGIDLQTMEFNVFAIPLNGSLEAMNDLMDAENLTEFAKSFKLCDLTPDQSNILVMPFLIDQVQAIQIMPGQLRSLVNDFIAFTDTNRHLSYSELVDNFKSNIDFSNQPIIKENAITVGQRLMLVLHMSEISNDLEAGNDINDETDMGNMYSSLSSLNVEFLDTDETLLLEMEKWRALATDLTGDEVTFGSPTTFPRACSIMATNRLFTTLKTEALLLGLNASGSFDEVSMQIDDDVYTLTASLQNHILGPVESSSIAIGYDREYFSDVLSEMTASVRLIEDVSSEMPLGFTRH